MQRAAFSHRQSTAWQARPTLDRRAQHGVPGHAYLLHVAIACAKGYCELQSQATWLSVACLSSLPRNRRVCCAAVESCEAALPPLLCAEECVYSARCVLNVEPPRNVAGSRYVAHRMFGCLFPLCSAFRAPRCNLTVLWSALRISWRAFASCMVYAAHLRVRRALVHCSVSYQRGRWRFYHSTGDTPVSSGAPRRRMRRRLVPFSTQIVRHEYCGMQAAFHAAPFLHTPFHSNDAPTTSVRF